MPVQEAGGLNLRGITKVHIIHSQRTVNTGNERRTNDGGSSHVVLLTRQNLGWRGEIWVRVMIYNSRKVMVENAGIESLLSLFRSLQQLNIQCMLGLCLRAVATS